MFTFTVVGIVRGSYRNKKTGAVQPYTRIYATYPLDSEYYSSCDVEGIGCDTIYLNRIIDDVCLGDEFRPVYNKYGTCIDIQTL